MSCLSMAVFLVLANGLQPVYGADVQNDTTKKSTEEVVNQTQIVEGFQPSTPQETSSGSNTGKYLIIGGAVALGVGVLALAGGGGGDDAAACEEDLVGPSIAGNTWQGVLSLVSNGTQSVSATITQCGTAITIKTTTTLEYGQKFVGTMDTNGDILVYDQITSEDWTTHYSQAQTNSIKLYDFVQNGTKLDSLVLSR